MLVRAAAEDPAYRGWGKAEIPLCGAAGSFKIMKKSNIRALALPASSQGFYQFHFDL